MGWFLGCNQRDVELNKLLDSNTRIEKLTTTNNIHYDFDPLLISEHEAYQIFALCCT